MGVVEHRFRVMASNASIVVVDPGSYTVHQAEDRLRKLERVWSRFIPTSDTCALSRLAGSWVPVDAATITLIESMKRAALVTEGAYDPCMVSQIVSAGYSSSIDDPARSSFTIDLPSIDLTVHDVLTDSDLYRAWAPPGIALDPGGIGKGLAADLVVQELLEDGAAGALVSIGGDVAAVGQAPTSDGWTVAIEDPHEIGHILMTVAIDGGGVATSSTQSRRWLRDGISHHHVFDPTTGRSAATELAAVTAVAGSGWLAEAHATGALLAGAEHSITYLERNGVAGVAVGTDGQVLATEALRQTETSEAEMCQTGRSQK